MTHDQYGGMHSSRDPMAVRAFEDAVIGVVGHLPSIAQALDATIDLDPSFVAAHALKGIGAMILAREELVEPARRALAAGRSAAVARGEVAPTEDALLDALQELVAGRLAGAAVRLDEHLRDLPEDLLSLKLSHAVRFMLGDSRGMLATTTSALDAWSSSMPGYGYVLGCHAFALEECGDLSLAAATGKTAVEHEPRDAWGIHAVAHVLEMRGRPAEGIEWIERHRGGWSRCNNFAYHMAWHMALFQIEVGHPERALALYDGEVRPQQTDDFRDIANAASLLWRLDEEGIDVTGRWRDLRPSARHRRLDTTLIFASLHYLLALIGAGDIESAADLAQELATRGLVGTGDQADVATTVGSPMAAALLNRSPRPDGGMDLARLALRVQQLGGSHAQRDVFLRSLCLLAADLGDPETVAGILSARRRTRSDDRFTALAQARLRAGLDRAAGNAGTREIDTPRRPPTLSSGRSAWARAITRDRAALATARTS